MSERSATAVKLHYVSRRNSPVRSALLAQLTDALQLLWVNRQKLQPPDFVFIHRQDNQCNDRASRPEFRPDNFTIHDTCTWIRIALFVMSTAKRATSTKSVLLNDHCLFTFFVSFFFFFDAQSFRLSIGVQRSVSLARNRKSAEWIWIILWLWFQF